MDAVPFWAVLLALCGGIVTIICENDEVRVINAAVDANGSEWLCVKTSKARGYVAGKYVKNKK